MSGNVDFYDGPITNPANLLGTQAVNGSGVAVLTLPTPTLLPNYIYHQRHLSRRRHLLRGQHRCRLVDQLRDRQSSVEHGARRDLVHHARRPHYRPAGGPHRHGHGGEPSTAAPPTNGTVTFFDNGSQLGPAQTVNAAGIATFPPLPLLAVGVQQHHGSLQRQSSLRG